MAQWLTVEGKLKDRRPIRFSLAAVDDSVVCSSTHDDTHPLSDEEFLFQAGFEHRWQQVTKRKAAPLLAQAAEQAHEYFRGRRSNFAVPLRFTGTPFQKKIWQTMLQIPLGECRSYGELAEMAGYPGASRAAGSANRVNKLGLFVPSHRIIAAGRKIGGYSHLDLKRRLLEHEGIEL